MAKKVLAQHDKIIQASITTPDPGFLGFGAKADGLYQRDSAGVENRLITAGEGVIKRVISSIAATTTGAALAGVDYVYMCSGTFTFTFPTAVDNKNRYSLVNEGTGVITLVFTAGQNANNSTSIALNPEVALDFISNNSNYRIF